MPHSSKYKYFLNIYNVMFSNILLVIIKIREKVDFICISIFKYFKICNLHIMYKLHTSEILYLASIFVLEPPNPQYQVFIEFKIIYIVLWVRTYFLLYNLFFIHIILQACCFFIYISIESMQMRFIF